MHGSSSRGCTPPFQLGAVRVNSVSSSYLVRVGVGVRGRGRGWVRVRLPSSNPVVGVTTIFPPLGGVLIATLTVDSPGRCKLVNEADLRLTLRY